MKRFTLVALMMCLSVIAFAQKPVKFGVYLGGAAPLGNLGQGDEVKTDAVHPYGDLSNYALLKKAGKQGYAGAGFDLGFDVTVNLPVEGLGVFGGLDLFYNSNNSDISDAHETYKKEWEKVVGHSEFTYSLPNFINIPILFGVNYQHNFNNIVGLFCEAGVGPNFRLISDYEVKYKYVGAEDEKTTYNYKAATTLGFKVGAGVMMWDKMSIVLDFYSLGSAKIEGTAKSEGGGPDTSFELKGDNAISASELVLRVGYHF